MFEEFKKFALRGNVIDLAVGVIIGAAFGKIVASIVEDIVMPVIGTLMGGLNFSDLAVKVGSATIKYGKFLQTCLDFSNWFIMLGAPPPGYSGPMTYEALTKAGVPLLAYGNFITVALNFIILAFIIFLMVKQINRLRDTSPPPAPPENVLLLREIRDALKK